MTREDLIAKGFVPDGRGGWCKPRRDPAGGVASGPVSQPKEVVRCQQCGKEFDAYRCASRKFCSLECAYQNPSRNRLGTGYSTPRQCPECGIEFRIDSRHKNQQFCTASCAARNRSKKTPRNRTKKALLQIICAGCQKPFQAWRTSHRRYCSKECEVKFRDWSVTSATKRAAGQYDNTYSHCRRGVRIINGRAQYFRSRMEANYARYLDFLKIEWQYEPKTFWFNGIKRGVVSYTPDFFLPKQNKYVETKGFMDTRSKTKLRRMKKYHPEIEIELVDWKRFKGIERTASKLIKDWEAE